MNSRKEFIAAVCNCSDIPEIVRDSAYLVQGIREATFDSTYLQFLSEQIQLNARGDTWSNRLRIRLAGLAHLCDRRLLDGRIFVNGEEYWVKVDPTTNQVVYWESYEQVVDTFDGT